MCECNPIAVDQGQTGLLTPPASESVAALDSSAPEALLTDGQRHLILDQWSRSTDDAGLLRNELLHELFEVTADVHPSRIAIDCAGVPISYHDLEWQANQLSHYLRDGGVGPGSFVALLLPRSADVYVTILAILKSGAAYVPLDPDYPADRVSYILADCKVHTLITTAALAAKHQPGDRRVVLLDQSRAQISASSPVRLNRLEVNAQPHDLCYVIYTSGSTGRPKGVEIAHRSACHLVRAEAEIFGISPRDRVYQGFSIAFDASVEEIWLALFSGAALVVGTSEMVHAGPGLSQMLTDAKVSVLSCVPTLLSMMPDDVPGVKLLIVGGEACPQDLVRRWARAGRRMVNTYGPTEATVIATWGDLHPESPVTIGRPVSNYRVYLLDRQMQPVPLGEPGELHLGGPGLARGYVGRPDLTAEKFVSDPFSKFPSDRLYKTGDLVRFTDEGEIEFLGRIDTQIKLRGFRIELSEIESALLRCPGIQSAVATVRMDGQGIEQLAGYIVSSTTAMFDEAGLKSQLRSLLPAYMIPSTIDDLSCLPTLSSGKVDRKSLPAPRPRARVAEATGEPPRTARERTLFAHWEKLFSPALVSRRDDFFLELGGHSLLAATMVSQLRKEPSFHDLSVLDVYHFPSIASLAAEIDRRSKLKNATAPRQSIEPIRVSRLSYFLCSLAQLPCLYVLLALYAVQWLSPYILYSWRLNRGLGIGGSLLLSLAAALVVPPCMLLVACAAKWLIIGRYRPGLHPLWGSYYLRWWLVDKIISFAPIGFLTGTPLLNIYLRLMGAKIGGDVHLASDNLSAFDLISIGDRSTLGIESSLTHCTVEGGWLKIGRIEIGADCTIGIRCAIERDTVMEPNSSLDDLSLLPAGQTLPAGETWRGSPAQRIVGVASQSPPVKNEPAIIPGSASGAIGRGTPRPVFPGRPASTGLGVPRPVAPCPIGNSDAISRPVSNRRTAQKYAAFYASGALLLPLIYLLAIFPGMILLAHLDRKYNTYSFLAVAPLAAISFVVFLCLLIAALKWILVGRVKPGTYPIFSPFHARKWFFDQLMGLSLDVMGSLYATLYLAPWYRLLGATLGKNAEISTASSASPDLLDIGDESFIADYVSLGAAKIARGEMTLAPTRIGKRAFVGNSAMVPAGTILGSGALIGVLSAPPLNSADAAGEGTSWLGSPAIFLPQRTVNQTFSERSTFNPTRTLYVQRYLIEFIRVILPVTVFVTLTTLLLHQMIVLRDIAKIGTLKIALLFPLMYLACGLIASAFVITAKWVLMGRYQPAEKPLWSTFVWRTELLTALHENLANSFLIELLTGTPWICWFFRMMGATIGSRVFMDTTFLTEFDLISIGDDAALNDSCTVQTHLFEDRVMKMSNIRIGANCAIGSGSVVLYDTAMEAGSTLGDLSLLMKGESLPTGTHWHGSPARLQINS